MITEIERIEALEAAKKLVASLSDESESSRSEANRVQSLKTANDVIRSLERPEDGLLKFAYSPTVWMAIRSCVHLDAFKIISEKETVSAGEIASLTGADETLIRRLLRVLTSYGYVAEKGDGVYAANKWTRHMDNRLTQGMIKFIYDLALPPTAVAPELFKETGFKNPVDPEAGTFQKAFNTKMPIFPWMALPENKDHWDAANTFFEGDRGSRPSWVTWFPIKEKLLSGSIDDQAPLLVDIAGGRGHDLMEFLDQFPDETGRFVLQDQPQVLDSATTLPAKVEKRPINFFKESPVEGAKVYFMKFIIHDYADPDCFTILRNVTASMKKGYSKLVINDFILPDTGCPILSAEWDLMMMVLLSAMERTETQWKSLLSAAGLTIEGMYQAPGDGQGIIVASL
ncbi:S-adenosyl-L-methionine-dependent methyltransferase [Durotheca rogersii]|uniref:S-adenosyl-L-methionine-dependent methyltransferase n=1 Tax=Durotheca rogersii TaxID=419775 RepID=UPI00221E9EE7|nr:S-adenosyl-L-methionine-dependent methyltransferase [Durotheca rogersii]KAI5864720.1 S-adenosyl-L-methionine-dependent methyltransferase [Durotheca rogersii]